METFQVVQQKDDAEVGPTNRSFGLTVGLICIALGAIRGQIYTFNTIAYLIVSIGIVLCFCGLFLPALLDIPNKYWMKLGFVIFLIINPIFMLIIYSLVFVPIGLIMRLFKYDPLKTKFHSGLSYWEEKERVNISEPMKYQF